MELILVGINHKTAPVEVRERFTFSQEQLPDALQRLCSIFVEGVILSTCNRTEVYAVTEDVQRGVDQLTDFLSDFHCLAQPAFQLYLYVHTGEAVAQHLFAVASGLDSMILGEPQILGQLRDAFAAAQTASSAGKYLSLLYRAALHAGKRARTETGIAEGSVSVCHAAVTMARQMVQSLGGRHIALVGTGHMGALLATCLNDEGYERMVVISRTFLRAQELAEKSPRAVACELSALDEALVEVDLVFASLSTPAVIIDSLRAELIVQQRQGRELYLIDIGVPRNIAENVKEVPGITLVDIDALQSVIQINLEQRQHEIEHTERILTEELDTFHEQWHALVIAPIIGTLLQKAEEARQEELQKLLPKLQHLSEKDLKTVQILTNRIMHKFLHEPIINLRRKVNIEHLTFFNELFLSSFENGVENESAE